MKYTFFCCIFVCIFAHPVYGVMDCCPPGQVILYEQKQCWEPKNNITARISWTCNETAILRNHFLIENGSLILDLGSAKTTVNVPFCTAYSTTSYEDVELKNATYSVVACNDQPKKIMDEKIAAYCSLVSVVFFMLTALIYIAFKELRDLNGKSLINFCIGMALGMMILAINNTITINNLDLCAVRGFLIYFFLLAAFFWSNSIAIQVLICTRKPGLMQDYGWGTFKWFFAYSWGCPTLLTIAMSIVNFHPGDHPKPGIGLGSCWFFGTKEQWQYMYSVMTILLVANFCIFIYTSTILCRLSFSSTQLKSIRYKFSVSIRLIIVMGLPWVTEMISTAFDPHIIWTILDCFNIFQGLLVFLLLVAFRPRVLKLLHKRGWLCCISRLVEKYLAVANDEENDLVQPTEVPMSEH